MNTDKIYAEQLANEYAPKDTSKVVALRKLDTKAKLPAIIFAYTFGIIAALVTGIGMCFSMNVIGNGTSTMFVFGVIIGIIGLMGMEINYPVYRKMLEYKLGWQGKELVKVDRFFPSSKRCCKCGKVKKELKLSERLYRCGCGNEMDRDRNAAINIREEARRMLTA